MSIQYSDLWNDLPLMVDADWCLSLGWKIRLLTNDPRVPDLKATDDQWSAFYDQSGEACGYYACWSQCRTDIIMINAYEGEALVGLTRIIELVVHEVSHMVDNYFARAYIKEIDTEVRAYMMDYFVGKIIHNWVSAIMQ